MKLFDYNKYLKNNPLLKEFDDEEGSGFSYEYQEGPGASPQEIARTIKQFQSDTFTWNKMAKNDFYSMAQGQSADIKSDYYPEWKRSDFEQVIAALEGGSTSMNEAKNKEKDVEIDIDSAEQITLKGKELDSDKLGTNKKYRDLILKAPDKAFMYKGKPASITAVDLNDGSVDEPKIYLTIINEAIGQENNYKKAALEIVALAKGIIKAAEEQLSMHKEISYASRLTDADQLSDLYYHLLDELGDFLPSGMDPFRKAAKKIIVDKYNIEMNDEYGYPMKWVKEGINEAEVDMMGKKCKTCGKGVYRETSQMDDMKGVLHCSKCGAETERYIDSTKVNEAIGQQNNYKKAALELVTLAKNLISRAGESLVMNSEVKKASMITDEDGMSKLYYHLQDVLGELIGSEARAFAREAKKIIVDKYGITMTDEYGGKMTWR